MAIDPHPPSLTALYTDDVVADRDDPNRVGVITRTAWEEEEEGEDDEEEDEEDAGVDDDGEPDRLPAEHARILWLPSAALPAPSPSSDRPPSLSAVQPTASLALVDRSLLHGDVVVRASDPLGPLGSVVDVRVELTLTRLHDRAVIRDVPSTQVSGVHPFPSGVHVTKEEGRLLGWVDDCVCDVNVRFDDGAECVVRRVRGRDLLDATWDAADDGAEEEAEERKSRLWYPGQQVKSRAAVWRQADWIRGSKQSAQRAGNVGVVASVQPNTVRVEWLSGVDRVEEDDSECDPADLRVLSAFEAARIMLGDHVLLPASMAAATQGGGAEGKEADMGDHQGVGEEEGGAGDGEDDDGDEGDDDSAPTSAAVAASSAPQLRLTAAGRRRLKRERAARRREVDPLHRCAQVTRTRTTVSVVWQNGTREEQLPSVSLLPRSDLVDNDFLPGDFVLARGSQRLACVQSVEAAQRTCRLLFLQPIADDVVRPSAEDDGPDVAPASSDASALPARVAGETAEVSIFDCVAHPRLELSVSSLVVRIPGAGDGDSAEVAYGTAGQVLSMRDGRLTVRWADPANSQSEVEADQVWNVDQPDEGAEDEGDEGDEEYDDDGGEEDEGEDYEPLVAALLDSVEAVEADEAEATGAASLLQRFSHLLDSGRGAARQQPGRPRATVEEIPSGDEADEAEDAEVGEVEGGAEDFAPAQAQGSSLLNPSALLSRLFGSATAVTASVPASSPASDSAPAAASSPAAPESSSSPAAPEEEDDELDLSSLPSRPPMSASTFSSFSVLPRPSSFHHFLASHPTASTSSAFVRKARSEAQLLSAHLPSGIHVLTYESRLDLLRCAIAGPARTPYHQSLFVFDVCLPSTFPQVPPVLHYHSRGVRLNPNLYAEGKVCLSLLNTWNGRLSERWNPDASTLLQVLLSLQGLVLGDEEPFYLEAGSATHPTHSGVHPLCPPHPSPHPFLYPLPPLWVRSYERLRGAAHTAVASVQYNETSLLLSLSVDASQLTSLDGEWAPLVQSHFASAPVLSSFAELQAAAAELTEGERRPLSEERKAAMQATFHSFGIPMGRTLREGAAVEATATAAATPAASTAAESKEEGGEEEKRSTAAEASAAPPSASLVYVPSSGFLSSLTRHLTRLSASLAHNAAQWTGGRDEGGSSAEQR